MNKITIEQLEANFNTKFSQLVKEKIENLDLLYYPLEQKERDLAIKECIMVLLNPLVKKSGEHRINDWERGWGENRDSFKEEDQFINLIPKYFGKYPYVRWQQDLIRGVSKDFEYNLVKALQFWLFDKHFSNVQNVCEFGCGTGHNLLRVNEINPQAKIYGMDWTTASQETILEVNKVYNKNFIGRKFDFFKPDLSLHIPSESGIYTFAALEQTSDKFQGFIDYLINQNPSVCVHIEPMWEYLESSNLMDYLSIKYFKKRNYLDGLKTYLISLEQQGKIEIIQDQRSYIGSMFVDGYSIIAWRPKNA